MVKYCGKCGIQVESGAETCPDCGFIFSRAASVSTYDAKKEKNIGIAIVLTFVAIMVIVAIVCAAFLVDYTGNSERYSYLNIEVSNIGDDPSELDVIVYIDDEICWVIQDLPNGHTESKKYRYDFTDGNSIGIVFVRAEVSGGLEESYPTLMAVLLINHQTHDVKLYV